MQLVSPDIFLFQIYSGYYYNDLQIFKKQQLIRDEEFGFFIVGQRDKNGHETLIPLFNFILRCFIQIDLKIGKLPQQDIDQLDMYVRWYEENKKSALDNQTIGIILCSEKNETVVKYSVLKDG